MSRVHAVLIGIFLSLPGGEIAYAQTGPTVEERLIRLEEGQKALGQRIEDVNRSLGQ
jgi:hypothetical protein